MIRTNAINAVGGYRESEKYFRVEDFDLWVRLYTYGRKGYNLQEPLYSMRDDRNAFSRRSLNNRINESRVVFDVCKCFKLSLISYAYVIVPVLKFFVPKKIYELIHQS